MQGNTLYFAADHAGFELKNELMQFVRDDLGYEVIDCGAYEYNEGDDFTDYISKAAREVSAHPQELRAIILGGSGQGEAMLANRFQGVRAVVYYGGDEEILILSRKHNDANVLSLGARFLEASDAKNAVKIWLSTPHAAVEKYDRRIEEMELFTPAAAPSLTLVPSLPAGSFEEIEQLLFALKGTARGAQIDIVDGVFVPHTSWPFTEEDPAGALVKLKQFTTDFEIEVDCMCTDPLQYLDTLVEIGVLRVVVHVGSTDDLASCIAHAKTHGYKIGIAFTNDVPLLGISEFISEVDFVQVMGIKAVGVQGQEFDERTLDTIAKLRKANPYLEIAVDGAVNEKTIPRLLESGATRFAPGSAITRSEDAQSAYKHLLSLIRS